MGIKEIEKAALVLSSKKKASLSYKLLESIDSENVTDTDKIWQKEVDARYKQLIKNTAKEKDSESVIREAKSKYK